MVDEVLDLSKIEAGRLEIFPEEFAVATLVEEVADTVRPLVGRNGNRLSVTCDPAVGVMYADITKTRQILHNLLSNAAKFTTNGDVAIAVRRTGAAADGAGWIEFAISDTGIGMKPERIEAAFRAFDQLDPSTTRNFGGTGLGLAISRHYSEAMGGSIDVDSRPGKGSVFTLRLPVPAAGAAGTAAQ